MEKWRNLKRDFGGLRRKGKRLFGILGNEAGVINVPDRPGYQYARIERGAERVTLVCKGNARSRLNTAVIIEQNGITGEFQIVELDVATTILAGDDPTIALFNTEPHAASQEWRTNADDMLLWLNPLQMYFLRVQPAATTGHVIVQGGPYFVGGQVQWKRAQSDVDLTSSYPGSGEAWVMLCIDANGVIQVVEKAGGGTALDIENLGPIPVGCVALAAVKLTFGEHVNFFEDIIPLWQINQFDASVLYGGQVLLNDGGLVVDYLNYPDVWGEWLGLQEYTLAGENFLALRSQWGSDFGLFGTHDNGVNQKDTVIVFGDDGTQSSSGAQDHMVVYAYGIFEPDGEYELRKYFQINPDGSIDVYPLATVDGVDISAHDHSGAGKGGTILLPSLGDVPNYVGHEGKFLQAIVGGTQWAEASGGGGSATTVVSEGHWFADGPLAVATEVGGVWRISYSVQIMEISIYLFDTGDSSNTIADFEYSPDGGVTWITLFTTTANRPTIAGGATDKRATGEPDITTLEEGDLVRMCLDQVAVGARGVSGQISVEVISMAAATTLVIPILASGSDLIYTNSGTYSEVLINTADLITRFRWNAGKIPATATVKLQARIKSINAAGTAYLQLYNVTAAAVVTGSEVSRNADTIALVESVDFKANLPATSAEYCLRYKNDSLYSAYVEAAWLMVEW